MLKTIACAIRRNWIVHGGGALGIAAWAAMIDASPLWLLPTCVLGWTLYALGWIDWQTLRLPDWLTLPLAAAGVALASAMSTGMLVDSVIGVVAGYAVFRAIAALYHAARGQAGLGRGDAKLLAAGGGWLGWFALPDVVLLAAGLALGCILIQRLRGHAISRETAMPFGPPLAAAIWLIRLYGSPIG